MNDYIYLAIEILGGNLAGQKKAEVNISNKTKKQNEFQLVII